MSAGYAHAGSHRFRERLAGVASGGARAGARVGVFETAALARGTMPPLHAHDEEERYRVLEGEVTFYVGGETVRARPGDVVVAPRDVPRTFCVTSETARWLVVTSLRSLSRYEDFSRAVTQPLAIGARPREAGRARTRRRWLRSRRRTGSRSSARPGCCRPSPRCAR